MTIIRATGTSEQYYRAERATIHVRVSVESTDRETSIATANADHNRLVERAKALRASGDATWHQADAPATTSYTTVKPGTSKQYILQYRTSSTVLIKLANLGIVGDLVLEFSTAGFGTNVTWALTEATRKQHERTARRDAVQRARSVADDYAEALGTRIATIVSIDDTEPGRVGFAPRAAVAFASAPEAAAEVSVPEITVTATVRGEYETAE